MKKLLAILLSLAVIVAYMPAMALADEGTPEEKIIRNSEELIDAINNQKANQTWVLTAGKYDIGEACRRSCDETINGYSEGFVFPIYVNNLEIKGAGQGATTITSSYNPGALGGVWVNQNFITIKGQGVKIHDLTLTPNPNEYENGQCNKAIELVDEAKDFTLENVNITALSAPDGKKHSGSIYFNVTNAGTTAIRNVKLASWLRTKDVTAGTVIVDNVVQDLTNNTYAGNEDFTFGAQGDKKNVVVEEGGLTIKVDKDTDLIKQVIPTLKDNTTIELASDVKVDEMLYIKEVKNVTIKGNGHTITASAEFHTGSHGQYNLVKIQESENVILDDVKLEATNSNKHTLDVWGAKDVVLNNVTLDHTKAQPGAPLIVNKSQVKVTGDLKTITGSNSWYAINVDDKDVKDSASINFEGADNVEFTGLNPVAILVEKDTDVNNAVVGEENIGFESNETEKGDIAFVKAPKIEVGPVEGEVIVIDEPYKTDDNGQLVKDSDADAIKESAKIEVTLTGGSIPYSNVRALVKNVANGLQIFAQDTSKNWYDVVKAGGWGPAEGFPLMAGYKASTTFYLVATKAGEYTADVSLVDINGGNQEELAKAQKTIVAEQKDNGNSGSGGGYYDPLKQDRNDATGAIEDAAKANAYDKEEQAVIDEIVANANSAIRKATTKEEIAKIKEDALKAIDEVMTSEEKKEAEEIANLKKVVGSTAIQLKSKKTEGAVRLYWTISSDVALDGYDVYRSKVKSEVKEHRWGGTTKTTYRNAKALKKGTRYNYKVRGYKIVNGEKVYTKWSNLNWRIAI